MPVLVVQCLAGKEELRDLAIDPSLNLEMDVRSTHVASRRRVRSRLDRTEPIVALVVSAQHGVALKVRIARRFDVPVGFVGVTPVRIGLPDLHPDIAYGFSSRIQNTAMNVNDLAGSSLVMTSELCQVGILFAWLDLRIERSGDQIRGLRARHGIVSESRNCGKRQRAGSKRNDFGEP